MADNQISMFADADAPVQGKPSSFTINKTINAGAQKVFDQWLIPVFLEEWMFGAHTGDGKISSLENTVRKGGEFNYQVERDGKTRSYHGQYEVLDIPRQLGFTWQTDDADDRVCHFTVQFAEDDGKTRLKLQAKIPGTLEDSKDAIRQQWTERCTALAARFKKS